MAVYGPVRHPKNIIWTEASDLWGYLEQGLINDRIMFVRCRKSYNRLSFDWSPNCLFVKA